MSGSPLSTMLKRTGSFHRVIKKVLKLHTHCQCSRLCMQGRFLLISHIVDAVIRPSSLVSNGQTYFLAARLQIVIAFIWHQGTVLCSGILLRQGCFFATASSRNELPARQTMHSHSNDDYYFLLEVPNPLHQFVNLNLIFCNWNVLDKCINEVPIPPLQQSLVIISDPLTISKKELFFLKCPKSSSNCL